MDTSKLLEAIEKNGDGYLLHIKVKIGKKNAFPAGFDEWRKRIEIEINEKPEGGRANRKIIETIAKFLDVEPGSITIKYGMKSRDKGIWVKGENLFEKIKNGL